MKRALLITLFVVITASFAAFCPLCAQDTAAWADFQQKAAAWRALPVKPALSDDLKRERLLAENAVSEKRFQDAVSHYEAGLKLNPMWPEGHFNAALVSAELTDVYKRQEAHAMQRLSVGNRPMRRYPAHTAGRTRQTKL